MQFSIFGQCYTSTVNLRNQNKFLYLMISEPCSAGAYRPADQTECVPCEEGTVSTETGATSCTSCDPGKQPNSDKTLCGWYLLFYCSRNGIENRSQLGLRGK